MWAERVMTTGTKSQHLAIVPPRPEHRSTQSTTDDVMIRPSLMLSFLSFLPAGSRSPESTPIRPASFRARRHTRTVADVARPPSVDSTKYGLLRVRWTHLVAGAE